MTKSTKKPSYLQSFENGYLQDRISQAQSMLKECSICPHHCGINRLEGELGLCRVGSKARVASYGAHFGEESPLVGQNGSGTIFFEGCNLLCIFCQNHDISHIDKQGDASSNTVSDEGLAAIMLDLQSQGCHNINLVTPSHVVPQFLAALPIAIEQGLRIPIVYNSSGYDSLETLHLLDGIVDIYMPDCKFWTPEIAKLYTRAKDYPAVMKKAICEMYRQVGDLEINDNGLACQGLLVRHLVMPGHLEETREILKFLAREISLQTYINIMDQYRPCYKADNYDKINRSLSTGEHEEALSIAGEYGLERLDQREWKKIFRLLGL